MSNFPRVVNVYKNVRIPPPQGAFAYRTERQLIGPGLLHCFGTEHTEYQEGPGNFMVGVVEMPDGTINTIPVDLLEFVEPTKLPS